MRVVGWLIIRRATLADARAIAEIQVRAHQWAYRGLLPDAHLDRMSADEREPTWVPQLAPDSPAHVFVLERDGRTVGFVVAGPSRDDDAPPQTGEVYAIYQEPSAFGTGVGRALMQQAIEDLRQRSFARATLWVLEGNARGRRFYERAGWRFDGTTRSHGRADHARTEVRYLITV